MAEILQTLHIYIGNNEPSLNYVAHFFTNKIALPWCQELNRSIHAQNSAIFLPVEVWLGKIIFHNSEISTTYLVFKKAP